MSKDNGNEQKNNSNLYFEYTAMRCKKREIQKLNFFNRGVTIQWHKIWQRPKFEGLRPNCTASGSLHFLVATYDDHALEKVYDFTVKCLKSFMKSYTKLWKTRQDMQCCEKKWWLRPLPNVLPSLSGLSHVKTDIFEWNNNVHEDCTFCLVVL